MTISSGKAASAAAITAVPVTTRERGQALPARTSVHHGTPKSNTKVVLMTRGNFDLHFTPVEEMDRMAPYHFAIEVEDWDGFLAHLKELGIRHTRPVERPENQSKFCYIHDPDHTMIELVYHGRRPS